MRTMLAGLDPKKRDAELKKFADAHCAQNFDCPPLIPWHHVVFDVMHAVHNELNIILDEVPARGQGGGARAGEGQQLRAIGQGARLTAAQHGVLMGAAR